MAGLQRSIYQTLPENSIRILELQPGELHEALECRLIVQQITEENAYEAISYVWGNPARDVLITCSGTSTGITFNLGQALTAFRYKNTLRRLWADAICINQEDNGERERQVGLMRLIYSSAQNILGWIGPDPGSAELAVDFMRKFNREPDVYIRSAKTLLALGEEKKVEGNLEPGWRIWMAIKELFEQQFFHRVWIIQELGLAKQALLYYGLVAVDWREVSRFVFIMDNQAAFLVNHLQLKSWIANHTNLIWHTLCDGRPKYSFIEVLNWARVHQATDPRDRIYGFLGHPSATDIFGQLVAQPDYNASAGEVFISFAMSWVNKTKELFILSAVDRNLEEPVGDFPTWVPAWNTASQTALFIYASIASPRSDAFISIIEIDGKAALRVRGFAVDTVAAYSVLIDGAEIAVSNLENERRKKIPFLLDRIWETLALSPALANPTHEVLDQLTLTLVSGFQDGKPAIQILETHRADFAAYLREFESIRDDGPGFMLSSFPPQLRRALRDLEAKGSAARFVQHMNFIFAGRRVFVTSNGHIGLGPQNMKAGDVCCVLIGSVVPIVLRRKESSNAYLLVGEAILQPYMNLEAFSLAREGKLKLREFLIV